MVMGHEVWHLPQAHQPQVHGCTDPPATEDLKHGNCLEQSSELSFSTCEMEVMTVLTSRLS